MYQAINIVTNGVFDQAKYEAYSPIFLTAALGLAYGIAFAAFPAVFMHTFCTSKIFYLYYSFIHIRASSSVVPQGHHPSIPQFIEG